MTNDREYLELAAKAAGMMFDPTVKNKHGLMVVAKDAACQSEQFFWNPLTDDGDALLTVLKELTGHINERFSGGVWDRARAAVRAVEEGK